MENDAHHKAEVQPEVQAEVHDRNFYYLGCRDTACTPRPNPV